MSLPLELKPGVKLTPMILSHATATTSMAACVVSGPDALLMDTVTCLSSRRKLSNVSGVAERKRGGIPSVLTLTSHSS